MIMNLILIAVFAASACLVNGQSCQTPSGGNGDCISIRSCQPLLDLVQNPNRTSQDNDFLRQSQCGIKDRTPAVCCPKTQPPPQTELQPPCYTSDGAAGNCISIYSCPHIAKKLIPPVSDESIAYVQNLRCSGPDQYSVCCGPETNADLTVGNCQNRMTAFPPDPLTECCGIESSMIDKIIGGTVTAIDQYPWLVMIEYVKAGVTKLLCGGALISGRYVVTGAHCVVGPVLDLGTPKRVRLGEYDISHEGKDCAPVAGGGSDCTDGVTRINIEKIISHPEYDPYRINQRNDIALLKLQELAPYTDFIRPICLPTKDLTLPQNTPANFSMYASGWGAVSLKQSSSNVKLHVDLPFVRPEECQSTYSQPRLNVELWKGQVCAGGQLGKDSCKGDSGGPLAFQDGNAYQLIGIVSFGPKPCGLSGIPGVYTKVFEYLDWINRTIVA